MCSSCHQTHKHIISFQRLWHWAAEASKVYRSSSQNSELSTLHGPLLDINPEGRLQREIKDIVDELDMMLHIYKKQREVMRRFCKHVEHILDPEGRWKEGAADLDLAFHHPSSHESPDTRDRQQHAAERAEKREQLYWFRFQAHELLSDVDDRIDVLEELRKGAESTAQSVSLPFFIFCSIHPRF